MGMPKFFFDKIDMTQGQICLHGEDEKHIKTVLRAKEGEELTLCDGEGMDYQCRISSLTDGVQLEILSKAPCETEPKTKITLYQGLPKADKMELIIQKCVELGVERIVAVSTERAIVKLDKKEGKKLERWQKIAEAAAKQSGRGKIPEIGGQVLKFKGSSLKDLISLKPIRGLKILNTWMPLQRQKGWMARLSLMSGKKRWGCANL